MPVVERPASVTVVPPAVNDPEVTPDPVTVVVASPVPTVIDSVASRVFTDTASLVPTVIEPSVPIVSSTFSPDLRESVPFSPTFVESVPFTCAVKPASAVWV